MQQVRCTSLNIHAYAIICMHALSVHYAHLKLPPKVRKADPLSGCLPAKLCGSIRSAHFVQSPSSSFVAEVVGVCKNHLLDVPLRCSACSPSFCLGALEPLGLAQSPGKWSLDSSNVAALTRSNYSLDGRLLLWGSTSAQDPAPNEYLLDRAHMLSFWTAFRSKPLPVCCVELNAKAVQNAHNMLQRTAGKGQKSCHVKSQPFSLKAGQHDTRVVGTSGRGFCLRPRPERQSPCLLLGLGSPAPRAEARPMGRQFLNLGDGLGSPKVPTFLSESSSKF